MRFFCNEKNIDQEIKRHREKENFIRSKIIELELIENKSNFDVRALKAYRLFLNQLLDSKAGIVSKIGKK